jgi:replicative DNA helicase
MMLSKDAIADVVDKIRSSDFYRPAHQAVYDAILNLYGKGEPADAVTVSAELDRTGDLRRTGGAPYLHTLIETVPTAANAGYYAEIVADKAILRRLVQAGTRIVQYGYAGADGQDVDDVVDRAQAEVYEVTERRAAEDYVPLEELLQPTMDEIDAIASRGGTSLGIPTGFADLDAVTHGLHPGQMIVVAARPGVGKALALDTPLPTPTGWTTMGSVRPGDHLLDAHGRPTRVVAATDVMEGRPCYEVEFSDGSVIIADAEHQWLTEVWTQQSSEKGGAVGSYRRRTQCASARVSTTAEIAKEFGPNAEGRIDRSVSNTKALQLPDQDLLVAPYALGVWLGTRASGLPQITSADAHVMDMIEAEGCACSTPAARSRYCSSVGSEGEMSPPATDAQSRAVRECAGLDEHRPGLPVGRCMLNSLRALNLLGDRRIPMQYLRGSEEQRRALLAGLLDTNGTIDVSGACKFVDTNERLVSDVAELITSLGYRCRQSPLDFGGGDATAAAAFAVTFVAEDRVFGLRCRAVAHKKLLSLSDAACTRSRAIVDVRPTDPVPVRCVQVDNQAHLYLAGRSMIPTHNSTIAMDFLRSCSIKHGMTAAMFSLEMSKSEIVMRLMSAEARIKLSDMRGGTMTDDDWTRLARRMGEISAAPLFIDDSPNLTMMEIRAKARRLKQQQDLKLVVVDYLQLMTSGKKVESRQQEVSEFSRQLKLLAKELAVPVVAVSQLNRGPEQRTDKRPQVSDLRESGSIEQDSDMVILLHRPDAFDRDDPRAGEADIILGKHRNGPTTTITVAHQLHMSRFVDMARG